MLPKKKKQPCLLLGLLDHALHSPRWSFFVWRITAWGILIWVDRNILTRATGFQEIPKNLVHRITFMTPSGPCRLSWQLLSWQFLSLRWRRWILHFLKRRRHCSRRYSWHFSRHFCRLQLQVAGRNLSYFLISCSARKHFHIWLSPLCRKSAVSNRRQGASPSSHSSVRCWLGPCSSLNHTIALPWEQHVTARSMEVCLKTTL